MVRSYIPYEGDLNQYGYGPEHLYFSDLLTAPPPQGPSTPAVPTQNPYASDQNPFIAAFRGGQADGAGEQRSEQSKDPGKPSWNGLTNAALNMAGFGLGPFSSLLGTGISIARGQNTSPMGIMGAIGFDPFGTATQVTPLSHGQQVRDMMSSPMGQTTGSASQDFFGAVEDLGTVGQLGAVLDARDLNRTSGPPPTEYATYETPSWDAGASHSGGTEYGAGAQAAAESGGYNGSGMFAKGGYLKGGTEGQADRVPALLSHGEYVIDAPTVAALGGGNNDAGAKMLDHMRKVIREISYGTKKQPRPVSVEIGLNESDD
jgi:hypothetical protein